MFIVAKSDPAFVSIGWSIALVTSPDWVPELLAAPQSPIVAPKLSLPDGTPSSMPVALNVNEPSVVASPASDDADCLNV